MDAFNLPNRTLDCLRMGTNDDCSAFVLSTVNCPLLKRVPPQSSPHLNPKTNLRMVCPRAVVTFQLEPCAVLVAVRASQNALHSQALHLPALEQPAGRGAHRGASSWPLCSEDQARQAHRRTGKGSYFRSRTGALGHYS